MLASAYQPLLRAHEGNVILERCRHGAKPLVIALCRVNRHYRRRGLDGAAVRYQVAVRIAMTDDPAEKRRLTSRLRRIDRARRDLGVTDLYTDAVPEWYRRRPVRVRHFEVEG